LDAKKGELFLAVYDSSGKCLVEPSHLGKSSILEFVEQQRELRGEILLIGEAARELSLDGFSILDGPSCDLPSPYASAMLGMSAWELAPHDMCDLLEPLYVRPPDAKLPANSPPSPLIA
jgi:tRNA A37 threonylcarbamoyladenosine modification protein TsaB